jgi:RimJ/RimL family protein N-acetyltransferase
MALRTERLLLDAPRESDIDAVFAACQDAELQRWVPIPSPYTHEDAEFFVRSYVPHGTSSGRYSVWALRQDDRPLMGLVEVRKDDAPGSASLGCWLAPEARGKGYMREAHQRILEFALDPGGMDFTRVCWESLIGNEVSMKLALALGFSFDPDQSHEVEFRGEKRRAVSGFRFRESSAGSGDAGVAGR